MFDLLRFIAVENPALAPLLSISAAIILGFTGRHWLGQNGYSPRFADVLVVLLILAIAFTQYFASDKGLHDWSPTVSPNKFGAMVWQ